jgi:putative acyl-CoA dehydrogenase
MTEQGQVPPLVDHDSMASDPALRAGLAAASTPAPGWLTDLAVRAGSATMIEAARQANLHPPALTTHDRAGRRVDEVEFHPAWHTLLSQAVSSGLHAAPWAENHPDAHVHRAAGFYLWTQTDSGQMCPVSMTYAAVPALRHQPELAAVYEPALTSRHYCPEPDPPATKRGLLAGMSMTEKQGGSDVRANLTVATPAGTGTEEYRLTGHKWFTSAPTNDLFLTLAQAPGGLTCFLVPRILPDGERNRIALVRLKDKLGNTSNASAEIEYDSAMGHRVGPEGRGIPTILEMVTMTRLDCVIGSAGQMRSALSEAAFYAAHRRAFDRRLVEHPAMTAVLADLAVESWAATLTGLRLAAAIGASTAGDESEAAFARLALPSAKYWVCKRATPMIAEALECLGGNGYVETYPMARLLRESPLNSIWEGSGSVTAMDAVRAISRSPSSVDAVLAELRRACDGHPDFDSAVAALTGLLSEGPTPMSARRLASLLARLLAASLLIQHAPADVADLYCATRLGGTGDRAFGELPGGDRWAQIVEAVTPQPAGR